MSTPQQLDFSALRERPDFQAFLADLRAEFLEHVRMVGSAPEDSDALRARSVMSYIADLYEDLAGTTVLGDKVSAREPGKPRGYGDLTDEE